MNYFSLAALIGIILWLGLGDAEARDPAKVREFRREHPCPVTGKTRGACPGWVVDHVIPLSCGGPDHPKNLQWQTKEAALQKDKLEWWACRCINNLKSGHWKTCPMPKVMNIIPNDYVF